MQFQCSPSCAGAPLTTILLWILDPATLEAVPNGSPGEIVLGGVQVAKGYLNRPEQTEAAFVPWKSCMGPPITSPTPENSPFSFSGIDGKEPVIVYRTGDIGVWRADWGGQVEVLGRKDDQLKVRGQRVEAAEIEGALVASPLIMQAAAALCTDGRLGALVVVHDSVWQELFGIGCGASEPSAATAAAAEAVASLSLSSAPAPGSTRAALSSAPAAASEQSMAETEASETDQTAVPRSHDRLSLVLRLRCRRLVPAFMIPSVIRVVPALPQTRTGKLARGLVGPVLSARPIVASSSKIALPSASGAPVADTARTVDSRLFSDSSVAAVWEHELGLQPGLVCVDDDFVSLGGDSLTALRVSRALIMMKFEYERALKAELDFRASEGTAAATAAAVTTTTNTNMVMTTTTTTVTTTGAGTTHKDGVHELNAAFGGDTGAVSGFLAPERLIHGTPSLASYARRLRQEAGVEEESAGMDHEGQMGTEGGGEVAAESPAVEAGEERLLVRGLWEAAARGESTIVTELLALGAPVNGHAETYHGGPDTNSSSSSRTGLQTPLHAAAAGGHASVVQALINSGASVRMTQRGVMAAHLACGVCPATLRILLDAGSPLAARDNNKQCLLHHAARAGHCECLRLVLSRWMTDDATRPSANDKIRGGGLEPRDRWHRTPVHWAVLNSHKGLDCLRLLLDAGADPCPTAPSKHQHAKRTRLRPENPIEIAERLYPPNGGEVGGLLRGERPDS